MRSSAAGTVLCLRGTVLCLLGTVLCVLGSVPGTMLIGAMLIPALGAETYPALEIIQRERKLQKRAKRALEHALNTVSGVAAAYESGRRGRGAALLMEIQAAVELADESLKATGKSPARKPRPFKRAEIETRKLVRELNDLETQLGYDERDVLQQVRTRIEEINEALLLGVMAKKSKKKK